MKGTAELDCICTAMNAGAAPVFHASGMHTPNLAQSQTNNHSAVKQPQRSQTTTAQSNNHSAVKQPQHSQEKASGLPAAHFNSTTFQRHT